MILLLKQIFSSYDMSRPLSFFFDGAKVRRYFGLRFFESIIKFSKSNKVHFFWFFLAFRILICNFVAPK